MIPEFGGLGIRPPLCIPTPLPGVRFPADPRAPAVQAIRCDPARGTTATFRHCQRTPGNAVVTPGYTTTGGRPARETQAAPIGEILPPGPVPRRPDHRPCAPGAEPHGPRPWGPWCAPDSTVGAASAGLAGAGLPARAPGAGPGGLRPRGPWAHWTCGWCRRPVARRPDYRPARPVPPSGGAEAGLPARAPGAEPDGLRPRGSLTARSRCPGVRRVRAQRVALSTTRGCRGSAGRTWPVCSRPRR
jgi:hypothetical protein